LPCFATNSTRLKVRHMLFSFHEVMREENLTYWIDYGTLLGSVRRGSMIPYDHDADAGYLLQDILEIGLRVAPVLKHKYGVYLDEGRPVQMRYKGARVDLFAMATYPDIDREIPKGKGLLTLTRAFYRVSESFERTYADTETNDILPTRKCPFENGWLMCPNKPEVILRTRYPYTYPWLKIPFKLRCYLNPFNLGRILFYGE